jgi:hypothetical protein
MIKDVMVRLDGTPADDVRLAAVGQIAEIFDSHITGLLFNALPPLVPDGFNGAGANEVTRLLDAARQAGDAIEATVFQRLAELPHPANLRRFDVVDDGDASDTALQMARAADTFVALRPNGRASRMASSRTYCSAPGVICFSCQTTSSRSHRSKPSLWRGMEAGSRHARLQKPSPICMGQERSAFLSSKARIQRKRRR